MLNRVEDQMKKLAALTGVMLMAAAEAMAQDRAARVPRRVVVSIPDRKLAVLENDRVLRTFPIAVGAPHSPSPTGSFKVISHVANPTGYYKGRGVGPGPATPAGTRGIGRSAAGYGRPGTNPPSPIGRSASPACIRVGTSDAE